MEERMRALEQLVRDLHKKLDDYHTETIANKTDIAWLKRGMIGLVSVVVTGVGSLFFGKLGG